MKHLFSASVVFLAALGLIFSFASPEASVEAQNLVEDVTAEHPGQRHVNHEEAGRSHGGEHQLGLGAIIERFEELQEVEGEERDQLIEELTSELTEVKESYSEKMEKHGQQAGGHEMMKEKHSGKMMDSMKQNCPMMEEKSGNHEDVEENGVHEEHH